MKLGLEVPRPAYPEKIDTYRELFKVYDSSEATLRDDIEPDSRFIPIIPRDRDRGLDVWGENGFVTIEGETIYYDSVSYLPIESKRPLEPISYEGAKQTYRLSQCQELLVSREILSPIRTGVEIAIDQPDLLLESTLVDIPYTVIDPSKLIGITLQKPWSSVGRFRKNGVWYTFVTKAAGGELGSGSSINPGNSGVTSIILTTKGITFFGGLPDLVEMSYVSTPDRDEAIAPSTIDIFYNGTTIVDEGVLVSDLVSEFTLDALKGIVDLTWNTIDRREIEVSFKSGLVYSLQDCIRGYKTESRPHRAGVRVSGFVMAEHHNNLVLGLIGTETLIGSDDSQDPLSIDYRLRMLEGLEPEINPECPQGGVSYEILDPGNSYRGPLVRFTTTGTEAATNRLFFGDGQSEENVGTTTHRYARGSQFSPTVLFENDNCTEYSSISPTGGVTPVLPSIILPVIPEIDLTNMVYNLSVVEPPTIDLVNFDQVGIPDVIKFQEPTIPTIDIPTQIKLPTLISIGQVSIPTQVGIQGFTIPTQISISAISLPSMITITGLTLPTEINLSFPSMPAITVSMPSIPTMITFGPIDIPSLITISLSMDYSIPTFISFGQITIPSIILISGLSIPSIISLTGLSIPTMIRLTGMSIPSQISISLSIAVDTSTISGNCFKLVPCTI